MRKMNSIPLGWSEPKAPSIPSPERGKHPCAGRFAPGALSALYLWSRKMNFAPLGWSEPRAPSTPPRIEGNHPCAGWF